MNRITTYALILVCIVSACSCRTQETPAKGVPPIKRSDYAYTAEVIDGQVYLQLNTNPHPDGRIGPFVKQPDGDYLCKTKGKGIHSLCKSPNGEWFYSWSYVHMRAQRVDGSLLTKNMKEKP